MISPPVDLDIVVLGGGGHVGLPLSLVFAKAGLRVGIYDTNQATLDQIAGGEMPFMENGADELLREILPTGRLEFGADGSMIQSAPSVGPLTSARTVGSCRTMADSSHRSAWSWRRSFRSCGHRLRDPRGDDAPESASTGTRLLDAAAAAPATPVP